MNSWFTWNGTRCTDYGIHVVRQPELIKPSERVSFTPVPDRSGTLTTLEGTDVYDDFLLTVECVVGDTSNLNSIFGWLKGSGKFTLANRQGGFYEAHIVNQISLEQILRGNPHRRFALNFRCQPFFYLSGVSNIAVSASGTFVTNPGSVFSEPVLKVTLTGEAQITMGGRPRSCRRRSSSWATGPEKSPLPRAGTSSTARAGSRRRSHPVSSQNRAAAPVAARNANPPSCSTSIHSPRYQCMRRRGRGCGRQKRVAFRRAI